MRRGPSLLLASFVLVTAACGSPAELAAPPNATATAAAKPPPRPAPPAVASTEPEPAPEPPEAPLLDPLSPLPPGAVLRLGTARMRFDETSTPEAAFTGAGSPIAIERQGSRTRARDIFTGRVLVEIGSGSDAALAPDASFLARTRSRGDAVEVSLVALPSGNTLWTASVTAPKVTVKLSRGTRQVPAHVSGLFVSPNGSHVALGFSSKDAVVLAAKDGAVAARLKPRAGELRGLSSGGALALLVDGDRRSFSFGPGTVKSLEVIDTKTGAVLRKLEPNVPGDVQLSPDGKEIIALSARSLVAVHVATGRRRVILEDPGVLGVGGRLLSRTGSLLVSPDGSRAAIWEAAARVVRLADGAVDREELSGTPVAFSADGSLLLTRDGRVAHVEGKDVDVPAGHTESVRSIAFAAGGRMLASAADDVRFWSARSGRMLARAAKVGHAPRLASDPGGALLVALRPELAALQPDGALVELGPPEPGFGGRVTQPRVDHAAPLPGGEVVAVVVPSYSSSSEHVRLWSATEPREIAKTSVPSPAFVAAGPDGERIAVVGSARGGSGSAVHVLDAKTLEPIRVLPVDHWGSPPVAFAGSDARLLVGGGRRDGLTLFDVDRGVALKRFAAGACCSAVAASRDGRLVAAAHEKTVHLWQVEPRKLQSVFIGHSAPVRALAFSPDGARLASASDDTTVLLWDTSSAIGAPRDSFSVRLPDVSTTQRIAPGHFGFVVATDPGRGPGAGRVRQATISAEGKLDLTDDPARIADVTRVASTRRASCALDKKGDVRCWGFPHEGTLGTKPPPIPKGVRGILAQRVTTPQIVKLPAKATDIVAGAEYVCAVLADSRLACWGTLLRYQRDSFPGSEALVGALPGVVSGLGDVMSAGVGDGFACALEKAGRVLCWGRGESGQLGDIQGKGSAVPVPIAGVADAKALSVGASHACALLASGAVACWGDNDSDQLGDGTGITSRIPKTTGAGFVEVAAGSKGTCGRKTDGEVACWGAVGASGVLPFLSPTKLPGGDGLEQLRFVGDAVCGVRSGTEVICVGARPVEP